MPRKKLTGRGKGVASRSRMGVFCHTPLGPHEVSSPTECSEIHKTSTTHYIYTCVVHGVRKNMVIPSSILPRNKRVAEAAVNVPLDIVPVQPVSVRTPLPVDSAGEELVVLRGTTYGELGRTCRPSYRLYAHLVVGEDVRAAAVQLVRQLLPPCHERSLQPRSVLVVHPILYRFKTVSKPFHGFKFRVHDRWVWSWACVSS